MSFKLNVTDEIKERIEQENIQTEYENGSTYKIVSSVFQAITKRKITEHGSFRNRNNGYELKCSLKANEGFVYPLEKCFLFIPKPPTLIQYNVITAVEFLRVGSSITSSRMFDMKIETNNGDFTFSNIPREEFDCLYAYLKSKKLNLPDLTDLQEGPTEIPQLSSEEESGDSSEEDKKKSKEKKEKKEKGKTSFGDDDDSESEDEDFAPQEESEVEEEFDEDYGVGSGEEFNSDDERAESKRSREKKEKKEKKEKGKEKEKKRKGSGSDDDSGSSEEEDEDEGKKKKSSKKEKEKSKGKRRKRGGDDSDDDGKKKRKKKDANAPKKALSAFMCFSREMRPVIQKEEKLSFGDVGKKLGALWGQMSAEEKSKYEQMAKEDKVRYDNEMKTYVPPKESPNATKVSKSGKTVKKQKTSKKESNPSSSRQMGDTVDSD